ncbi:MAG: alanine racemase [Alphaproteobacteria bacterium]
MSATKPAATNSTAAARAGAILHIDLAAVQANYRALAARTRGTCAAVIKADAYGLGTARVAPALAHAGADTFFTALLDEAITVRKHLAATATTPTVYALNGIAAGPAEDFLAHGITPVLNSLGEIEAWAAAARAAGRPLPAAIHIDTGMNRLGLPPAEVDVLADQADRLAGIEVRYVMSHLACAEAPDHPLNGEQLAAFTAARARLPKAPASLANSSGIFLGPVYHFDLLRPGAALYGINPTPRHPNPMRQTVNLQGKILQVREIDAPRTVGYGAAYRADGPTRVATVAVGYADGYLRSLSKCGCAWIGGQRVSLIGRVSMDLTTFDVTGVSREAAHPGALVDLIGTDVSVDDVAESAGTIGYEILTALGHRYHRIYSDD